MAQIKISELVGPALDWAVAQYSGTVKLSLSDFSFQIRKYGFIQLRSGGTYSPSTDWKQAGDIIGLEGIAIRKHSAGTWYAMLSADLGDGEHASWSQFTARGGERYGVESWAVKKRQQRFCGETPLIAAMRCYVASKAKSETVEVPDVLVKQ